MGILGLFVLGSCNNRIPSHTHTMNTIMPRKDIITRQKDPIIPMKANIAENTIMKQPMNTTKLPEAHSDEIILPKAKAEAAGVKVSVIEPAPFQQVIKTSGQVLAAQGMNRLP